MIPKLNSYETTFQNPKQTYGQKWFMDEVTEIEALDIPAEIRLALFANASIEKARREGLDYDALKKDLIAMGVKDKADQEDTFKLMYGKGAM